jgi:serine/threonine protein kinase
LGDCAEGSKRLIVYEYMSNGSLADVLFKGLRCPNWDERVRIALDVARRILYLHEECKAPIIHCDINP